MPKNPSKNPNYEIDFKLIKINKLKIRYVSIN